MLIWLTLTAALAGNDVKNPGGERIPFVKLRSEVWDVVIRKTADTRARIERVKAKCQGIWVNACAAGVDPELRQIALQSVFQEGVALSGDFTYCSTAVVRDLPEDLGRKLIRSDTESFCQTFLDPDSVQGQRSGNATTGENDLVGRLFGGKDTTSGKLMMKAPPTQQGRQSTIVTEATGERRKPGRTAPTGNTPLPMPVPTTQQAPVPQPEPSVPEPEPTAPEPTAPEPAAPEPQYDPNFSAPGLEADDPVFVPPVPKPEPEPLDPELAELLEPVPEPAPPPPPPKPTGPSEFELEAMETENLERLSDKANEEDGKKKKKKGKKKGESDEMIGGDEEFDNYIIIDIESLSDE